MSLSITIREQLIRSFGDELAEHVQAITDGLLALEQRQITGEERQFTLENIFRAAHSLKGDARALGVSAVEQLAHALENVLDAMQRDTIELTPELFTVCYRTLDTIQLVQAVYESGGTTPPVQVLQTLSEIEAFRTSSNDSQSATGQKKPEPRSTSKATPKLDASSPDQPQASDAVAPGNGTPTIPEEFDLTPGELPQDNVSFEAMPDDYVPPRLQAKPQPEPPSAPPPPPADTPVPSKREQSDQGGQVQREQTSTKVKKPVDVRPTNAETNASITTTPVSIGSPKSALPSVGSETIRVSVDKLDALMAQLSELLVTKIRSEQRLAQIRLAQDLMAGWQKEWLVVRKTHSRLINSIEGLKEHEELKRDMANILRYVDVNQEQLRQVHTLINTLSREYANDTMQASLVIDALEEEVKQIRMLPLSTITGSFGRMVRDLAQAAGKEAMLKIVGGEVELDKRVLEKIKDPLIHLLRNAIDHGLESPAEREAAGKPSIGTITLHAEQAGKDVVIRVSDDGSGLDTAAIRRVATQRGGISNAWELGEAELVELIFNSRFSTSPIITDVSGRGVGLDVVRSNVEALGGRINVKWKTGKGSTFILILPLTVTSSRGLLVRVSGELFAIPFSAIERIVRLNPKKVLSLGGHEAVRYNGRPLPLLYLGDILELPRVSMQQEEPKEQPLLVVVLAAAERQMAFVVDELAGEQEMVVKGLGSPLMRVGGIAGATVMGDGDVLLVLNVTDLLKLAVRSERRPILSARESVGDEDITLQERPRRHILVVDDSVTTRTLEKNILEAAGYNVQLATDGQEALGVMVTSGLPDLVISDIVMPRLNGFGLTERIKSDERMAHIPVILVSSLDSPEDKTHGIEAGADAYIIKNRFDQNNLLETIEQLI